MMTAMGTKTDITLPSDLERSPAGSPQLKQTLSVFVRIPLHERQRFMALLNHAIASRTYHPQAPILDRDWWLKMGGISISAGCAWNCFGTAMTLFPNARRFQPARSSASELNLGNQLVVEGRSLPQKQIRQAPDFCQGRLCVSLASFESIADRTWV
jgi:hypothetical protein